MTFHFGPGLLAETAAEEADTLVAAAPFTFRQTAKTNFCPQCDDNVNFFLFRQDQMVYYGKIGSRHLFSKSLFLLLPCVFIIDFLSMLPPCIRPLAVKFSSNGPSSSASAMERDVRSS